MKSLVEFMNESYQEELHIESINEGKVTDEKSFRELAHSKLKKAHGDDYDEKKADEMIDGILKDNKELADKSDWGALVGILNKGIVK